MRDLIAANYARMKKNKVFWLGMIFMFGFAVYAVYGQYQELRMHGDEGAVILDNIFFRYTVMIGLLSAIFSSLFLGTEYSDGTIRNKIVVGHRRRDVYLANLFTNVSAILFMEAVYLAVICVLGIGLIGSPVMQLSELLLRLFGSVVLTAAFASISTMLSMICRQKAVVATVAIVGTFLMLMLSSFSLIKLSAPEYFIVGNGLRLQDANGNVIEGQIQNPDYLEGTEREIHEQLLDILPTGQALQYADQSAAHPLRMPVYSMLVIVLTTGSGIAIFRKKDIL